ncbi:MAG TPA: PAS domain-containing protein [Noviherbaspirillum sp.]|nr:PAS domain-containing protein [Noviherbaspirillum sp.]
MDIRKVPIPAFLSNGGEMSALMRAHDWSRSPLGPPDTWPRSLCTVVDLMLSSRFPKFIAWGLALGVLYNDAYIDILGARHPSALGRRLQDVWPEIWEQIRPIVMDAMEGKSVYHRDLPLTLSRKGHEEQTWFTFSYSPLRDDDGRVAGMFCTCIETTAQVLAERHRIEEVERLRQLFQQAPGVIAVLRDPDHVFELANDAYLRLVGNRQVLGKPVREALPEVEGQGFFEQLDRVYASGEPFVGHRVPVKLRSGAGGPLEEHFLNFVYQPIRDYRGKVNGIFIEGNDVTDAVKASQALQESEERLRQLVNTIPQLAWIANPDGQGHWYNDRWFEYTGLDQAQLAGTGWKAAVHPEDLPHLLDAWQTAVSSGRRYEATARLRAGDGTYRTFIVRAVPLRDPEGRIVQWFGSNTDVSVIEAAQRELKEANRRKDEFLAMLAHELRNPLAPIAAATDLLKLGTLDADKVRQASHVIARQVEHMTKLVDDLLDVSRVTRGLVKLREESLNINDLVANAIEQVQAQMQVKHHLFISHVPDEQFWVRGDRTRLIQVFSNILNNAAKFTPPEGRIRLHLSGDGKQVSVAVEDNGIGIAPSLLPHIFDLFTQGERSSDRSLGGLGLGLALVRSLLELQGGSVSVHSDGVGLGSRFLVQLPRIAAPGNHSGHSAENHPAPAVANQKRLMVVDDNRDAALTLSLLLETTGHKVTVAHNAADALSFARRLSPSILFLDIGLPDMEGYELARRLRRLPETAGCILVAVTGYGQPEDKARAMQAGFDHHFVKPVKLGAVLALLATLDRQEPPAVTC